nr:MAG TPA: hypothetical protein [Caudoviricetes sp.]
MYLFLIALDKFEPLVFKNSIHFLNVNSLIKLPL